MQYIDGEEDHFNDVSCAARKLWFVILLSYIDSAMEWFIDILFDLSLIPAY